MQRIPEAGLTARHRSQRSPAPVRRARLREPLHAPGRHLVRLPFRDGAMDFEERLLALFDGIAVEGEGDGPSRDTELHRPE